MHQVFETLKKVLNGELNVCHGNSGVLILATTLGGADV